MEDTFDPTVPIELAWTPPSRWYQSPLVLERERESLLRNTWQFVGRADPVREPGSYFTVDLAGEPLLVSRAEDGELRAFFNVCRHHAALVMEGAGTASEWVCPYHGWCYHLDGSLKKAPRLGAAKKFNASEFGLVPVHVTEWGPLVGISLGKTRPPEPGIRWPRLSQRLFDSGWDDLVFVERRSYDMECNWKVYVDNYLDGGYHVSVLHPDLAGSLDLDTYTTLTGDEIVVQESRATPGKERLGAEALYAWLYPNFMINRYGPVLDTNYVIPLSENRSRVVFDFYFSRERAGDSAFVAESLQASEKVQQEDIWISESVQRGLQSSAYDRGRYAPNVEQGEYFFHQLLARDYNES